LKQKYAAWMLVVAALVPGCVAVSSHLWSPVLQQTLAADEAQSAMGESSGDSAAKTTSEKGHSWTTIVTTAVLIVLAIAVTFVMARLQRRRKEAFEKAAKKDKEEARLAARSSPDLDNQ